MTEDIHRRPCRVRNGVNHRRYVLVLALKRVVGGVPAQAAPPAINRIHGVMLFQTGADRRPASAVGRCAVNQHEGWAFSALLESDLRPIA